ncbi:uncharacterized protein B0H18DRAFT_1121973 [Fomitopsis serialis]|uniref:uncharacterized protein n=1 Tax=Fomitopsis serialis TaxID=139415 RepID=UPI002007361B|nr:uncharacterized protein B0H18DRAFT_1121973 [Neoantrodia serialis]KAH9920380.1 hypothetical protein B0H18DRAFT_1121973 [Neoantrodia serialis]
MSIGRLVEGLTGAYSLITDEHLKVILKGTGNPDPNVWALGDAAMIKEMPLPATAQGMPALLLPRPTGAPLTRPPIRTSAADPFRFHNVGSLAYVGDWQVVYDRTRTEKAKAKEAGRFARLLWHSAHFTMTLS